MFVYDNSTGSLWLNGQKIAQGYSGKGTGLNNPAAQYIRNVGPIPVGVWRIGKPRDSAKTGPLSLPLEPVDQNQTGGRSGFVIHGDR